jgi:hypothetical protein
MKLLEINGYIFHTGSIVFMLLNKLRDILINLRHKAHLYAVVIESGADNTSAFQVDTPHRKHGSFAKDAHARRDRIDVITNVRFMMLALEAPGSMSKANTST